MFCLSTEEYSAELISCVPGSEAKIIIDGFSLSVIFNSTSSPENTQKLSLVANLERNIFMFQSALPVGRKLYYHRLF
jgi:hypothetical protein